MYKVRVERDLCISCGLCESIASNEFELELFRMDDENISEVNTDLITEENKEKFVECARQCPTDAIIVED